MTTSLFNLFFSFQLISALFETLILLAHSLGLGPSLSIHTEALLDTFSFFLWCPVLLLSWTNSRIPLRLIFPLLFFSLWSSAGLWPLFPSGALVEQNKLAASLLNLLVQGIALLYRRHLTKHPFGLFAEDSLSADKSFSLLRLLLSFPLSLALVLLLSLGLQLGGSLQQLSVESKDHVKVRSDGLYTLTEIYQGPSRQVMLVGMMHIAEAEFYQRLLESLPSTGAVILSEGVSDRQNLLEGGFSYRGIAKSMLLSEQGEEFQSKLKAPHEVIAADIDVSQLRPETINFLKEVSRLYRGQSQWRDLQKIFDPSFAESFRSDLIERRNQEVLGVFDKLPQDSRTVVIPWGALHNAQIAEGLELRGYQRTTASYYQVLSFTTLVNAVWARISS